MYEPLTNREGQLLLNVFRVVIENGHLHVRQITLVYEVKKINFLVTNLYTCVNGWTCD